MTKTKKILTICLTATGLTITPSVIVASVVTNDETFSNKENSKNNYNANKYSFFDYDFNTKDEIIEYVTSSANVNSRMSKTPYRWTLNVNNKLVTFDNQEELFNYLNNFIEIKSYTSYTNSFKTSQDGDEDDLKTDANGALLPSELSKMNFNEDVKTQRVYRGKNNSIHLTEKEAKDTYFEKHEVYYFNGIFFRTKEELSVWLEQNMNNLTDSEVYEITFQNIAGNNSIPINVEKLKSDILLSKETNKIPNVIDNFVRSNNKSFIEYKSALQPNTKKYISSEHVDEIHDYEANYVQMISNQGKGNYIIDTSTEDSADLIGPYYVKSGTEILQITDRSKWKKISGTDHHVVDEMLQKELICKFMNLILATPPNNQSDPEYNESNVEPSKNALYTIPVLQKEINEYFDDLCNNFPNVYKSVQKLYNTMKQGKKFGEFLKTPVLFVHTIDQIIYYNGSQEFIDKTRDIYSKICDHFDKLIYSTIPKTFLKSNNGTYFTTKDLFKVDNNNLDLNYDIETLIGEILYEYPHFYECIQFICNTEMYLSKLNTLENIEFSTDFYKSTFNLYLDPIFEKEYKLIWDTLNSEDLITLYDNVEKINPEMKEIIPYYYINNFLNQQCSNKISKIAISYWLNPQKAKQEFADELGEKEIEVLEEISKPSPNNAWFKLSTISYNNNIQNHHRQNFNFLKKLYESEQTVDPILFSRLILYMTFYNNRNNLETIFGNKDIESIKWEINSFIESKILSNYNNLDKLPQLLFSRNNFVLDKVVSKYGIESIKFPDLSNKPTFFKKKPPLTPLEKDVKRLKFGKCFKKLFASTKGATGHAIRYFKPNENKLWAGVSFATNFISGVVSLISLAVPWLGGVSIILDFLASIIYKKEYFSYIFETNDVKYVWNGGVKESWLLGLKKGECSTIDDMKLLEPMQVIKPNNLQGYYYNGEIYSDLSLLKTKQLMDVSNGRYKNKNFKTIYSLIDLEKPDFINDELYDTSLDKLNKKFLNYVEKAINTGEFKNDSIVKPASYKFGSYVKNENLSVKGNIEKILESIKPTLIAQTPILNPEGSKYSRIPIFKNNTDANDNSISPYKLPGTSWTADGGLYNNNDYNFIIVDQNVIDKTEDDEESNDENQNDNNENIGSSRKNEVIDYNKKLENDFYNSFDVDSKVIDSQFVYSTKLFSDLSSKIESNFCYFATGRDLEENIFLNKNDAINWLLSEFNFTTYYVEEKIEVYQIKDLVFTSKKKFMNWILSNIVEVK